MNKSSYEISLWEDYRDGTDFKYLKERKLVVIGSDTMTSPCRAVEPKLVENINGTNTFTFKMYYTYTDEFTGEKYTNPFLKMLVNERKVKVKWEDKWYDFIIKNCQEDSNGRSITYTCKDLYITELSKTGFDIVLDTELQNNMGTAQELTEKVLEGTDWRLDKEGSSNLLQTTEEPVYESEYVRVTTFTAVNQTNNEKSEIITTTDKSKFLTFYSQIQDILDLALSDKKFTGGQKATLQFLFSKDGEFTTELNKQLVLKADCYSRDIYWTFEKVDDTQYLYIYATKAAADEGGDKYIFYINITNGVSNQYRGERLIKSQKTLLDPITGKNVKVFTDPQTKHNIYMYTSTEYRSVDAVTNLITNGSQNFVNTDGWANENIITIISPPITSTTNISTYNPKGYLLVPARTSNTYQEIYNSGIHNNSSYLQDGFAPGEQYIFRIKARYCNVSEGNVSVGSYITIADLAWRKGGVIPFNPRICTYNTKDGVIKPGKNGTVELVDYFDYTVSKSATDSNVTQDGDWIQIKLTCKKGCTRQELFNKFVGFFIMRSDDSSSGATNFPYVIEDIQFFKYVMGKDNTGHDKMITPNEMDTQSVATIYYNYYDHDSDINLSSKSIDDIEFYYRDTKPMSGPDAPVPTYSDKGFTKVRSISVSTSNRFNILQTIAETFKCWVKFTIQHDSTGAIIRDDTGKPQKYITLVENVGQETGIGFIYGIDLKTISRTIQSDQIVTKTIVTQNNNEFAEHGFCTIARAEENYPKTNFLLNFDYFISQGLLDGGEILKDLYDPLIDSRVTSHYVSSNSSIGYYYWLRKYNIEYDKITEELTEKQNELMKQSANFNVFVDEYTSLSEEKTRLESEITRLANGATFDDDITRDYVRAAAASTSEAYNRVKSLINKLSNLKNQLKATEYKRDNTAKTIDAISAYIEQRTETQEKYVDYIKELDEAFYNKYSRYLQEGSWISENYYDDNLYYLDAQSVAYTSSRPQVSYNISVIRLSALEDFKYKKFKLGDISYIQDTDFFGYKADGVTPYKEQVILSEITSNFDDPSKDSFRVQNYKTQFEDLFQRIAATTQSLQYTAGEYEKVSSIVDENGNITGKTLQDSLKVNQEIVFGSNNESVTYGSNGITLINNNNRLQVTRIVSGGILVSSDGGATFSNAVTGAGISADQLTAGTIDVSKLEILNGKFVTHRWDASGITAYSPLTSTGLGINAGTYVRFDHFGIYGITNNAEFEAKKEDDIWNTANFGLTWKGFFLKNGNNTGRIEISSLNDISIFDNNENQRIKIGRISGDGTELDPYIYGMRIADNKGVTVLETNADGQLWLRDILHISSGNDYNIRLGYLPDYKLVGEDNIQIHKMIDVNEKFIVWEDGSILANDAELNNGSFSGKVEATEGSFTGTVHAKDGDFHGDIFAENGYFKGNIITTGDKIAIYENDITDETQLLFGYDGSSKSTRPGLYVRGNGIFTGTIEADAGVFRGEVVSEQIKANGGIIGGFQITQQELVSTGGSEYSWETDCTSFDKNCIYFYQNPKFVRTNDTIRNPLKSYYYISSDWAKEYFLDKNQNNFQTKYLENFIIRPEGKETQNLYLKLNDGDDFYSGVEYYEFSDLNETRETRAEPRPCIEIGLRPEVPEFSSLTENGVYRQLQEFVQNTSNKWNYNMFYIRHEDGFIEIEKEDGTKELVENYTYEKLTNRPLDWEQSYNTYYTRYEEITQMPEDWELTYYSYFIPIKYKKTVSKIILDGTTGNIYAGSIVLGKHAQIETYIKVGNSYWFNPEYEEANQMVLALNCEIVNGYPKPTNESVVLYDNGYMTVGTLSLDGVDSTIKGNNWYISPSMAHFQNVTVSGKISTSVFEINHVQALGGSMFFKPSYKVQNASIIYDENTELPIRVLLELESAYLGGTTSSAEELIKEGEERYCYLSSDSDTTVANGMKLFTIYKIYRGKYYNNKSSEWQDTISYYKLENNEYVLLSSRPSDWDTNYTNYYLYKSYNAIEVNYITSQQQLDLNPIIAVIDFGKQNDIVMGINSNDTAAGPLYPEGLTFSHLKINKYEDNNGIINTSVLNTPNLFLGNLDNIKNSTELLSLRKLLGKEENLGYGLYGNNVFLKGGIISYEYNEDNSLINMAGILTDEHIESDIIPFYYTENFELTDIAPEDWEDAYNIYYMKDPVTDGHFIPVKRIKTEQDEWIVPPWEPDKYYKYKNRTGQVVIFAGARQYSEEGANGGIGSANFQVTNEGYVYSKRGYLTDTHLENGNFVGSGLKGSIIEIDELRPRIMDTSLYIYDINQGIIFKGKKVKYGLKNNTTGQINYYDLSDDRDVLKFVDNGIGLVTESNFENFVEFSNREIRQIQGDELNAIDASNYNQFLYSEPGKSELHINDSPKKQEGRLYYKIIDRSITFNSNISNSFEFNTIGKIDSLPTIMMSENIIQGKKDNKTIGFISFADSTGGEINLGVVEQNNLNTKINIKNGNTTFSNTINTFSDEVNFGNSLHYKKVIADNGKVLGYDLLIS